MTNGNSFRIEIIAGTSLAPIHIDDAVRSLLDELDNVPQVAATLAAIGPSPHGSKGIVGNLPEIVIAFGAAGAVVPTLITAVREWLLRQPPATTIRIKDGDFEIEWCGTNPPAIIAESLEQLLARRTA